MMISNGGDYFITEEKFRALQSFEVKPNDLIISCSGTVGRIAIIPEWAPPGIINQALLKISLDQSVVLNSYFLPLFRHKVHEIMLENARGSAMLNITGVKDLKKVLFPIAPLSEQNRIVAEIDKQFTRLDAGVASLKRVQLALKRYRASVLKAACEGRLVPTEVELIRKNGKSELKTGEFLLQGILEKPRRNWTGRGKYLEPLLPDATRLWSLPVGWTWVTIDALAEVKGGITKDQNRKHTASARPIPYLRVANVQRGYLDLSEMKEIIASEEEIRELALKKGDILFNEGGDRDKLGRGWVWNGELSECIHQNHVFRARLFDAGVNPKFVSWFANTVGQKFFFDEGKHTTNLASISMTKLKGLPVRFLRQSSKPGLWRK